MDKRESSGNIYSLHSRRRSVSFTDLANYPSRYSQMNTKGEECIVMKNVAAITREMKICERNGAQFKHMQQEIRRSVEKVEEAKKALMLAKKECTKREEIQESLLLRQIDLSRRIKVEGELHQLWRRRYSRNGVNSLNERSGISTAVDTELSSLSIEEVRLCYKERINKCKRLKKEGDDMEQDVSQLEKNRKEVMEMLREYSTHDNISMKEDDEGSDSSWETVDSETSEEVDDSVRMNDPVTRTTPESEKYLQNLMDTDITQVDLLKTNAGEKINEMLILDQSLKNIEKEIFEDKSQLSLLAEETARITRQREAHLTLQREIKELVSRKEDLTSKIEIKQSLVQIHIEKKKQLQNKIELLAELEHLVSEEVNDLLKERERKKEQKERRWHQRFLQWIKRKRTDN